MPETRDFIGHSIIIVITLDVKMMATVPSWHPAPYHRVGHRSISHALHFNHLLMHVMHLQFFVLRVGLTCVLLPLFVQGVCHKFFHSMGYGIPFPLEPAPGQSLNQNSMLFVHSSATLSRSVALVLLQVIQLLHTIKQICTQNTHVKNLKFDLFC